MPVLPPVSALIEVSVMFAAIVGLDWLLPGIDVTTVQPHPFWLPVLVLSLQYGTVSGLVAAAIAVLLNTLLGFPEQDIGENHFAYLARVWTQPILWISAAVVLGQFRMRQIERKRDLIRRVDELTGQRIALADYARSLRDRCDALERQLAGRIEPSAVTVLARLAAVDEATSEPIGERLARAVDAAFPGAAASLHIVKDGSSREIAAVGRAAGAATPPAPSATLASAVLSERRSVSVLDAAGEHLLAGAGVVAVPVTLPAGPTATPTPLAILRLERLEPEQLTDAALPAARMLAQSLAPALAREALASQLGSMVERTGPALPPAATTQRTGWRRLLWPRDSRPLADAATTATAADAAPPRAITRS